MATPFMFDTRKKILRNALDQHGVILFEDPRALGDYSAAIDELVSEGVAETASVAAGVEVRRRR